MPLLLVLTALLAWSTPVLAAGPGPVSPAQAEATPQPQLPGTLQQGTPAPGGTPTAFPEIEPDENDISGTVAAVSGTTLTINNEQGELQTIEVPAGALVVRDNQPASLESVEATDRVVVQRGQQDEIQRLIFYSVPPTPAPSPTVAPEPTVTAAPEATPAPEAEVVTGAIQRTGDGSITVATDSGETRTFRTANVEGLEVFRDGDAVSPGELRTGDLVSVTVREGDVPSRIEATSAETPPGGAGVARFLIPLLLLLPLMVLVLLVLMGSRGRDALLSRGWRLGRRGS